MHPTIIPFLTAMEVNSRNKPQPFIAIVNHNTLTSAKVIQILHTVMGNFCHGYGDKISQLVEMGNDSCLLMGYHNKVSSDRFLQIICIKNNFHQCIARLSVLRKTL